MCTCSGWVATVGTQKHVCMRAYCPCISRYHIQITNRILTAQYLTMAEGVQKPCGRCCRRPSL